MTGQQISWLDMQRKLLHPRNTTGTATPLARRRRSNNFVGIASPTHNNSNKGKENLDKTNLEMPDMLDLV